MLSAGFAEMDITPPIGVNMPGGFLPQQTSMPARGHLFASSAAFTVGDRSVILVSMDILSSHSEYTDELRGRISQATGVPTENILISAIHTHTGPALEYQLWLCPPDEEVSRRTADQTVFSAVTAWNDRKEARFGVARCFEKRYSFNRDCRMSDGTIIMNPPPARKNEIVSTVLPEIDQSVNVMRVEDRNGEIRCFIVNYANHPDCHHRTDKKAFSADFAGYMRRALKRRYGEHVKVLFFNGTAGDVNCLDFRYETHLSYYGEGKCAPETIGNSLAEDIERLDAELEAKYESPYIDTFSGICTVSRRHLTQKDREWAQEIAKDMDSHKAMDRAFATEYLEPDTSGDTVDLEVHTIRLGPWTIVGLPSEIYTEIGLAIKARSPYENTLIFELSNGTNGYISPDYIQSSAAYEGKVSKYNAYCGPETAGKLVDHVLAQLKEMKRKEMSAV